MNGAKTKENHMSSDEIPLPPTAQVVADVIGRDATLALAFTCQHRCVYVPGGSLRSNSYLVRTIGKEKAELMKRHFEGELLPMATCYKIKQTLIQIKIQQLKQLNAN